MGKHNKRRASYLPKVAAGAAPLALLLASPATGWAAPAQADSPLPVDHHNDHSLKRDFDASSSLLKPGGNPADFVSFLKGFVAAKNHDVFSGKTGDSGYVADLAQATDGALYGSNANSITPNGVQSAAYAKGHQAGMESQKYAGNIGGFSFAHDSIEAAKGTVGGASSFFGSPRGAVDAKQSFFGGLDAARNNTERGSLGGFLDVLGGTSQKATTGGTHDAVLDIDPEAGTAGGSTSYDDHFALADSAVNGLKMGDLFGTVSKTAESLTGSLTGSLGLVGDSHGNAHGQAKTGGALGAARSSEHGINLGGLTGLLSSAQDGKGAFSGTLDAVRTADGSTATTAKAKGDLAYKQAHAAKGKFGPLSLGASSAQSGKLGVDGSQQTTVGKSGKHSLVTEGGASGSLSDRSGGELGVDHLLKLKVDESTDLAAGGKVSQTVRDGKAGKPKTDQSAKFSHESHLSLSLLDGDPIGGGLKLGN